MIVLLFCSATFWYVIVFVLFFLFILFFFYLCLVFLCVVFFMYFALSGLVLLLTKTTESMVFPCIHVRFCIMHSIGLM